MPTTLFAAVSLFAPLHVLLRRLLAHPFARPVHVNRAVLPCAPQALPGSSATFCMVTASTAQAARPTRMAPPLRVVRVMDAADAGRHSGRMVISGRMADVCAELDRMAARES